MPPCSITTQRFPSSNFQLLSDLFRLNAKSTEGSLAFSTKSHFNGLFWRKWDAGVKSDSQNFTHKTSLRLSLFQPTIHNPQPTTYLVNIVAGTISDGIFLTDINNNPFNQRKNHLNSAQAS